VHDSQLIVKVLRCIHQLLKYQRCLVLLKESVLFGIFEKIALRTYLGDDINMGFRFELVVEFDYILMVALLQYSGLSFQHLLLRYRQFERLYNLDGHLSTCVFLYSSKHI
jgi:hypothetical protein